MPKCGSQISICDLPIRFDTYKGCSHMCSYCFVKLKYDIANIERGEGAGALLNFIQGKRDKTTNWCDWNIPIHWGGVSDPFQPIEKIHKYSLQALKVFAETQYPVVISTKGALASEEPYLSLLEKCNVVMQFSLVSPKFDKIEPGAPTFEQRIEMIRKIAPKVKRVIGRAQPFVLEAKSDILNQIKLYKEIGVHGITIEGLKYRQKKPGLVKIGADYCYPKATLKKAYEQIKNECHKHGLSFYAAENRLRNMGDDLCCCGIDGLEGFTPNKYNLNHYIFDRENFVPSDSMKEPGTSMCLKAVAQNSSSVEVFKIKSLDEMMQAATKDKGMIGQLVSKQ